MMFFDAHDTADQKVTLGMVEVLSLNTMIIDTNLAFQTANLEEFGETIRPGSRPLQNS